MVQKNMAVSENTNWMIYHYLLLEKDPLGLEYRFLYHGVACFVTWSSSDLSVATVSNTGKVVAVRGGNCTITATAGGKSATCTVRVQGAGGVDAGIGSWEDSDEDYGGTVN